MNTTIGRYQKPTFEARAEFVAAQDLKWGNDAVGYRTIPHMTPLEFDALDPPCDEPLAAKLYRTGHIAMVLTEDGKPKLKESRAAQAVSLPPAETSVALETTLPPAAGLSIKSHGFGRFSVVDENGNRVAPAEGWLKKAEAEAIVANAG